MLNGPGIQKRYEVFPACESTIDSSWYSSHGSVKSLDECLTVCTQSNMCTGFHYDPKFQRCSTLNYTQHYAAKQKEAGDALFYLLDIDMASGQG